MIRCCKPDCPDRSPTCHATCERYAKEKAVHESERLERQKEEQSQHQVYRTLADGANRAVSQYRNHKKIY